MAEILKRNKALSVNPLKASQPMGGSLACLGFDRAMPMLHGSQGCTAFAKVFFVRHFREPIPLQTTAMDQASSVMGADENVIEGIKAIAEKSNPALIMVLTTGLAETQGADVHRNVREFRERYPEYNHVAVVAVNTPDFTGCVETGYASAVYELIKALVPNAEAAGTKPGNRKRQVNVLVSPMLTPGDLEALRYLIGLFNLRPVLLPDISESLDGSLTEDEFSPVTIGGTSISEVYTLGEAKATLVIGSSLKLAGELLQERTAVPSYYFEHLYSLQTNDDLICTLAEISGQEVPQIIERQRSQLQDAMLDTHFMLGQLRIAIAADPDQLNAFVHLVKGMGAEVVAAISASNAPILAKVPVDSIKIGDLEDLEILAKQRKAQLLIGNSHAVATAERLGIPILRAGFPLYDIIGGYQKTWIGYRGVRQALFDLANLVINFAHEEIEVYHSPYAQKPEAERKTSSPSCH
jgi:nitrogenase molybdenum-iron protein NifN